MKNNYQFLAHVKNGHSIFTNVKNRYHILKHVKNRYQVFTDVKNWYLIFTDANDIICNIKSHVKDSIHHMTCGCKRLGGFTSFSLSRARACKGMQLKSVNTRVMAVVKCCLIFV